MSDEQNNGATDEERQPGQPTAADRVNRERQSQHDQRIRHAQSKGGRPKGSKDKKRRKQRADKGKPKFSPQPEPPPEPKKGPDGKPIVEPVTMSAEAARKAAASGVRMLGKFAARIYGPEFKPKEDEEKEIGGAFYDYCAAVGWIQQLPAWVPLVFAVGGYGMRVMLDIDVRDEKIKAAKKKAEAAKGGAKPADPAAPPVAQPAGPPAERMPAGSGLPPGTKPAEGSVVVPSGVPAGFPDMPTTDEMTAEPDNELQDTLG